MVDLEVEEHCDGHAGADGPHDDAKAETRRGEDDARCFEFVSNFKALDSKFFGIRKSALLLYDLVLTHVVCVSL